MEPQSTPHHETPELGNPDLPPEGLVNTTDDPGSTVMTGPQNPALAGQFPSSLEAPATDVSTQPFFWSSFNISPRRVHVGFPWRHNGAGSAPPSSEGVRP